MRLVQGSKSGQQLCEHLDGHLEQEWVSTIRIVLCRALYAEMGFVVPSSMGRDYCVKRAVLYEMEVEICIPS